MDPNLQSMRGDFECECARLTFECYHSHFIEEGNTTDTLNSSLHISPNVFEPSVIIDYYDFENKLLSYVEGHEDKLILIKILISIIATNNSSIDWAILSEESLAKFILTIATEFRINSKTMSDNHKNHLLIFLGKFFSSLDFNHVHKVAVGYTALPLALRFSRLTIKDMLTEEEQNDEESSIIDLWISMSKHTQKLYNNPKVTFLHYLIEDYWTLSDPELTQHMVELLIILISQKETNQFVKYFIKDILFIKRVKMTQNYSENVTIQKLIDSLESYLYENEESAYSRLTLLKKLAFKYFPNELAKTSASQENEVGSLCSKSYLQAAMMNVDFKIVTEISKFLRINTNVINSITEDEEQRKKLIIEMIGDKIESKNDIFSGNSIEDTPCLMSEFEFYDEENTTIPIILNLNSINIMDYMYRLFHSSRKELINSMRKQIQYLSDIVNPQFDLNGKFDGFENWSKDACPINYCRILTIKPAKLGERYPEQVIAEAELDISIFSSSAQEAWVNIRSGEILAFAKYKNSKEGYEVSRIRCCEVQGLVYSTDKQEKKKDERQSYLIDQKIRVFLLFDEVQFKLDQEESIYNEQSDIYEDFQIALRMSRKESAIKHALDVLHNKAREINPKSRPVFNLRFNDPDDEEYICTGKCTAEIKGESMMNVKTKECLLKLIDPQLSCASSEDELMQSFKTIPFVQENFIFNEKPLTNQQLKGVLSGVGKRCTMITGESGSGKTFVIMQIMKLLMSRPNCGRILLVTKSDNQLDYLFERIDPKYLVRFGGFRGYRETNDNDRIIKGKDLSPSGQVDRILKRRLQLLKNIKQFAESIEYKVFEDFSCERADYMYNSYCILAFEKFKTDIDIENEENLVKKTIQDWEKYPFKNFVKNLLFPDSEGSIFIDDNLENKRRVFSYWGYIQSIFEEVSEYRALELIREQKEREKYVMCSFAKVVGMTASYLMINQELPTFGLTFDTVIFENANRITEVEKFLALTLQKNNTNIKRVIMSGSVEECKINEICLTDPTCDLIVARNPGVNMIPFKGKILEPMPKVYQNFEQAQFITSVYMYLRLMGQPKYSITILTLCEGQVELIRDMFRNREQSWYERIGNPKVITHVDDYDGQENEVILISMVKPAKTEDSEVDFEPDHNERLYQMLKVALSRATKSVYCFGDFEDPNNNVFTMKENNYHRGLHYLVQSLPKPEPFKIVKDGEEIYIYNNSQLTKTCFY